MSVQKRPRITVLMSVFNENEIFLKESIESICKQTERNFEFIIFDDCSESNVKKILNWYEKNDVRIRIVHNDRNKGLTYNLAEGVKLARAKYICRQDSDDISLPNRFEEQLNYMENHKDIAVLGTGYYLYKNQKKKPRCFGLTNPKAIKARLFFENSHIMHSSVMIRKSFLYEYGLNYDINFKKAQDYDLWARISECGKITILKKRLCMYRVHEKQISSNDKTRKEQIECFYNVVDRQLYDIGIIPNEMEKKLHHSLVFYQKRESFLQMISWIYKLVCVNNKRKKFNRFFFDIYCLKKISVYLIKSFFIMYQ